MIKLNGLLDRLRQKFNNVMHVFKYNAVNGRVIFNCFLHYFSQIFRASFKRGNGFIGASSIEEMSIILSAYFCLYS